MIQFDESEHYQSALDDDTLRLLRKFLTPEAYDKLLIGGGQYPVGFSNRFHKRHSKTRFNLDFFGRGPFALFKKSKVKKVH